MDDDKTYFQTLQKSVEKMIIDDPLLGLIGNTPAIPLKRMIKGPGRLKLKLEGMNPSGSLKDRAALYTIANAIRTGELNPDRHILDASSGNMSSALCFVANRLGYKTTFVVGNTLTQEKRQFMELFGARLIPYDGNTWESSAYARKVAEDDPDKYCFVDQFHNKANLTAHYMTTGPEMLKEEPDIDVYIASLGSGASLCGAGKYLKQLKPDIRIVGVTATTGTRIPGLRNLEEEGFKPPLADFELLDDVIRVAEDDALDMTKTVLREEGLLLSLQGGAVVRAALNFMGKKSNETCRIIALIGESFWKGMDVLMSRMNQQDCR
jgi:cysteine synthase